MNRYIKRVEEEVEGMLKVQPKSKAKGLLSPKKQTMSTKKNADIVGRIATYVADIRKMRMGIKNGN